MLNLVMDKWMEKRMKKWKYERKMEKWRNERTKEWLTDSWMNEVNEWDSSTYSKTSDCNDSGY